MICNKCGYNLLTKITPELIIQHVTTYYGITVDEVMSSSRKRVHVMPRQIIMYLLSNFTQMSLIDIGKLIGDRDHTTVIHSKNVVRDLRDVDDRYRSETDFFIACLSVNILKETA